MGAFAILAITAGLQIQQGRVESAQFKSAALKEETAASDREIKRRQRLLSVIARQNVLTGASGTAFEGSPLTIQEEAVSQAGLDRLTDASNTRSRIESLESRAGSARTQSLIDAGSTLFGGFQTAARRGTVPGSTQFFRTASRGTSSSAGSFFRSR